MYSKCSNVQMFHCNALYQLQSDSDFSHIGVPCQEARQGTCLADPEFFTSSCPRKSTMLLATSSTASSMSDTSQQTHSNHIFTLVRTLVRHPYSLKAELFTTYAAEFTGLGPSPAQPEPPGNSLRNRHEPQGVFLHLLHSILAGGPPQTGW